MLEEREGFCDITKSESFSVLDDTVARVALIGTSPRVDS